MSRTVLAVVLATVAIVGFAGIASAVRVPIIPINNAAAAAHKTTDVNLDELENELRDASRVAPDPLDAWKDEAEDELDNEPKEQPRFRQIPTTPTPTAAATSAATTPVATAAATVAAMTNPPQLDSTKSLLQYCWKWITPNQIGSPIIKDGHFLFPDPTGATVYSVGGCKRDANPADCLTVDGWNTNDYTWKQEKIDLANDKDGDKVPQSGASFAQTDDGSVYDFGGSRAKRLSNTLGRLYKNTGTQKWTWEEKVAGGEALKEREMASMTAVGSEALVVFGGNTMAAASNELFVYEISKNAWFKPEVTGDVPSPRFGHSATLVGRQIYFVGGSSGEATFNTVHILTVPLDLHTKWSFASQSATGTAVPTPRALHAAAFYKGLLFVLPGFDPMTNKVVSGVFAVNVTAHPDEWKELPAYLQELSPVAGRAITVSKTKGLVVSGGDNRKSSPLITDYLRPTFLDTDAVCDKSCVHGKYNSTGLYPVCDCDKDYQGKFCDDLSKCPNECKNGGVCKKGVCVCALGFGGADCTKAACPNNCTDASRGTCSQTAQRCVCQPGSWGLDCSQSNCPSNCMGRGICQSANTGGHVSNWCLCMPGFSGNGCENYAVDNGAAGSVAPASPSVLELAGVKRGALYSSAVQCPNHCSGHGVCTAFVTLTGSVQGVCQCASGFGGVDCSGECTQHCSGRDGTANGECQGADGANLQCKCKLGFSGPGCNDRYCPANCTGTTHGKCENNECLCLSPYSGGACEIDMHCSGNGKFADGQCTCMPGWGGVNCDQPVVCQPLCQNGGTCVGSPVTEVSQMAHGVCQCPPSWGGPTCSERTCPNGCSVRGLCNDGVCKCYSGFAGDDCSTTLLCPQNCTGTHGTCKRDTNRGANFGVCDCTAEWTGADCSLIGCPNNCYGRGKCREGKCDCNPGYTGQSCESMCPNRCSDRGICLAEGCKCYPGFFGEDCSQTGKCAGTPECSGNGVCYSANATCFCAPGFSGKDCGSADNCGERSCSGKGTCKNGVCYCNPGFSGDHCEREPLCEHDCYKRGICWNGKCNCYPAFNGTFCELQVQDTSCPKNCTGKGVCVQGVCYCIDGQTGADCDQVVDYQRCKASPDAEICEGRGVCQSGRCFCDPGFAGAYCDEAESCPLTCVPNQGVCMMGRCRCLPGFGGPDCSQDLVCEGSPVPCSGHGVCIQGQCACDGNYGGADCSKLLYGEADNATCLNDCGEFGVCKLGKCFCVDGYTGPDCSTVVQNACPEGCSGNGVCRFGSCFCKPGYAGKACQVAVKCSQRCLENGVCAYGKCFCVPGWTGRDCDVPEEDPLAAQKIIDADIMSATRLSQELAIDKSLQYCKGGCGPGVCMNNTCFCPTGFYGANCRNVRQGPLASRCGNQCNGQGKCVLGNCYCFAGFGGRLCDKPEPMSCPNNCNDHGRCHRGMCFCDPGWEGGDCKVQSKCEAGCTEGRHGICQAGKCVCVDGFTGSTCNETLGVGSAVRFQERPEAAVAFSSVIGLSECSNDCGANGLCVNKQCYCKPGFSGPDCSVAQDDEKDGPSEGVRTSPLAAKLADAARPLTLVDASASQGQGGQMSYLLLGGLSFAAGVVVCMLVQVLWDRHRKLQQERQTTQALKPIRQAMFPSANSY